MEIEGCVLSVPGVGLPRQEPLAGDDHNPTNQTRKPVVAPAIAHFFWKHQNARRLLRAWNMAIAQSARPDVLSVYAPASTALRHGGLDVSTGADEGSGVEKLQIAPSTCCDPDQQARRQARGSDNLDGCRPSRCAANPLKSLLINLG